MWNVVSAKHEWEFACESSEISQKYLHGNVIGRSDIVLRYSSFSSYWTLLFTTWRFGSHSSRVSVVKIGSTIIPQAPMMTSFFKWRFLPTKILVIMGDTKQATIQRALIYQFKYFTLSEFRGAIFLHEQKPISIRSSLLTIKSRKV